MLDILAGINQMTLGSQTFFAYSDEFGSYKESMSEKHLRAHPYYIRSVILLPCDKWKSLEANISRLKCKHRLPLDGEIKWAHLWSLRSYQKNAKEIPKKHPCYFLRDIDYHVVISFVEDVLAYYAGLQDGDFQERCHSLAAFQATWINGSA
jgi:hypothetical protein